MERTAFVPMLAIGHGTMDIEFYKDALGAIELRRLSNDDGSVHVAEMTIDGAMFHLHEENVPAGSFAPARHNGVTATIGLMVADVDAVITKAVAAGAKLISEARD